MIFNTKILLIGCGKMGGAMLKAWLRRGADPKNIVVVDLTVESAMCGGATVLRDSVSIKKSFKPDVIVFAVKPNVLLQVASQYMAYNEQGVTYISIAAGKKIEKIEKALGGKASIVRAMPNLPAIISKGVTVAIQNSMISKEQHKICSYLLEAIGALHWINDEKIMDSVTAISGSGPAYIFYFIESFIDAGIKLGLPENFAKSIATETVLGSVILAYESKKSPATLRRNVTSKGGTTEAGLEVLMSDNGLKILLEKTSEAAFKRSKELK